jgi:adenylate cyclase
VNPRLQRHVRTVTTVVGISGLVGAGYALAQGHVAPERVMTSALHGVGISFALTMFEIGLGQYPARDWIARLSFTSTMILRSLVYVLVIVAVHLTIMHVRQRLGIGAGSGYELLDTIIFSSAAALSINFVIQIANLLGPRTLINFFSGRYHQPLQENRFVLFVDIAGSTGLAERLGGVGIHRFLDRTFRLLTGPVVDAHGEILGYVGDELIVTWPEEAGAIDARPLRCFLSMRETLERAATRLSDEFGAAPKIRGSLNFGPVIAGEIGDIKRAIVFNGDTMNAAARLEELSRTVEGGFLAARAAIERLGPALPVAMRDLGAMPIRGRVDAIAVMGLNTSEAEVKARLSRA